MDRDESTTPEDLDRPEGNDLREHLGWLREAYLERGLTQQEIADRFGCCQHHVSVVLRENDIPTRSSEDYIERGMYLKTWSKGYERIYSGKDRIYHHRLLAVAMYGIDQVVGKDVHHRNSIPWDNRPENIEIIDVGEHMSKHAKQRTVERDEMGRFA